MVRSFAEAGITREHLVDPKLRVALMQLHVSEWGGLENLGRKHELDPDVVRMIDAHHKGFLTAALREAYPSQRIWEFGNVSPKYFDVREYRLHAIFDVAERMAIEGKKPEEIHYSDFMRYGLRNLLHTYYNDSAFEALYDARLVGLEHEKQMKLRSRNTVNECDEHISNSEVYHRQRFDLISAELESTPRSQANKLKRPDQPRFVALTQCAAFHATELAKFYSDLGISGEAEKWSHIVKRKKSAGRRTRYVIIKSGFSRIPTPEQAPAIKKGKPVRPKKPPGYYMIPENRIASIREHAAVMGGPQNVNSITAREAGLAGLINNHYDGTLFFALREAFPQLGVRDLPRAPKGYFDQPQNRIREATICAVEYAAFRGMRPEELTRVQFKEAHLLALLRLHFNASTFEMLFEASLVGREQERMMRQRNPHAVEFADVINQPDIYHQRKYFSIRDEVEERLEPGVHDARASVLLFCLAHHARQVSKSYHASGQAGAAAEWAQYARTREDTGKQLLRKLELTEVRHS